MSELRKEGESGQRKINKYTRYGTVVLAAFQAIGVSKMLAAHGVAIDARFFILLYHNADSSYRNDVFNVAR